MRYFSDVNVYSALLEVFRLSVWLIIVVMIFVPLERLFALHPARVFRKDIVPDLGYYFLNSLLITAVMAIPLSLAAWAAHRVIPGSVYAFTAAMPFWQRGLAAVIVGEIGFYWGHRWTHEIPFLWRFHAIHHSPEHLDFMVNTRAHPVDIIFVRLCGLVPLVVFGLAGPRGASGSTIPALLIVIGTIWGFFIHSNVRWRLGPLEWILSSPAHHHWHHTKVPPRDRNYAPMLPVVDRIFGTLHLPKGPLPAAYGIDDKISPSFWGQLVQPLRHKER